MISPTIYLLGYNDKNKFCRRFLVLKEVLLIYINLSFLFKVAIKQLKKHRVVPTDVVFQEKGMVS